MKSPVAIITAYLLLVIAVNCFAQDQNYIESIPANGDWTLSIGVNEDPVVEIKNDGTILWKGREIESDDDFKKAMLDLKKLLTNSCASKEEK